MQRCSSHIASKTDIDESVEIGRCAVKTALEGKTGCMMCYIRDSSEPYRIHIESLPVSQTANHEKYFPLEWINDEGNNISDEAIKYFLPLIQGEVEQKMKNGMPVHFVIE